MNVSETIAACLKNNRRAQNSLYKEFYPLMHNIVSRYFQEPDQISSIINQGFFKVLKSLKKYNDEFAFATWLRRILVNTCIDEYRKNKALPAIISLETDQLIVTEIETNVGEENLEIKDLLKLVFQLNHVQRTVFNLSAIDGYSHAEIGDKLKISEGACRWHLNQARKKLKKLLNDRILKVNRSLKSQL
jgi:RNA polymerase sigma-70 factor (ECF subfamily)